MLLGQVGERARSTLEATHRAREEGLGACRSTIQACSRAIRAVHRDQREVTEARVSEAKAALRRAQEVLAPHPTVAAAGFLHDAEKEYAEARLTVALIDACNRTTTDCPDHGDRRELSLPAATDLGVGLPAWLNGLAEAATELRRHLLDRLRSGELVVAERLLRAMEDVYDVLVTIDYPDAVTGGLRRSTDALRGVLERSRGDLTLTLVQARLQAALQQDAGTEAGLG